MPFNNDEKKNNGINIVTDRNIVNKTIDETKRMVNDLVNQGYTYTNNGKIIDKHTEMDRHLDYPIDYSNGENNTGYRTDNVFNSSNNVTDGYRKGSPPYVKGEAREITVSDHDRNSIQPNVNTNDDVSFNGDEFFVKNTSGHFIKDMIEGPGFNPDGPTSRVAFDSNNKEIVAPVFSGATTSVNPLNDETTAKMLKSGTLSKYIEEDYKEQELGTYNTPPISPMQPFQRLNRRDKQFLSDEAVFKSYNRTKLPIADSVFRKGFRHIFFTRPECYLTYKAGNTIELCDQAFYDEDFSSAWSRMPHIIKLLSPYYVTGSFQSGNNDEMWNYLLCNQVQGMNAGTFSMSVYDNIAKSPEGFTVTPAMHVDSRQGSTIELSFNDTKNLEVFEMLRLWQLYMYKRRKGVFAPPFNGYVKNNTFMPVPDGGKALEGVIDYTQRHPYDRALEYCASLYDIVTNETGTKILYWCKYYGIYPTQVSPSLSNSENKPITDMKVSATFKYHYRLENVNKTLIEFNYNAGITNELGSIIKTNIKNSMPFLLRNQYDNPILPKYIGASGMFTGSPYIVMAKTRPDPTDSSNIIITPNLRFMNVSDIELDGNINAGLTNVRERDNKAIGTSTEALAKTVQATSKSQKSILKDYEKLRYSTIHQQEERDALEVARQQVKLAIEKDMQKITDNVAQTSDISPSSEDEVNNLISQDDINRQIDSNMWEYKEYGYVKSEYTKNQQKAIGFIVSYYGAQPSEAADLVYVYKFDDKESVYEYMTNVRSETGMTDYQAIRKQIEEMYENTPSYTRELLTDSSILRSKVAALVISADDDVKIKIPEDEDRYRLASGATAKVPEDATTHDGSDGQIAAVTLDGKIDNGVTAMM